MKKPVPEKWLMRFLVLLVVILAILAGYYREVYRLEMKKYARLEDKYVRVRTMIGRQTMKELIDESYDN